MAVTSAVVSKGNAASGQLAVYLPKALATEAGLTAGHTATWSLRAGKLTATFTSSTSPTTRGPRKEATE